MPASLVTLQQVTAAYNHEPVWHGLDLTIAPGQCVALVGPPEA